MGQIPDLYAVVPAGGAGTRLWPLSRAGRPKFLLDLLGTGRTLLQSTVDRVLPLTGADHVLVVTGAGHVQAVTAQLPELDRGDGVDRVLGEPSPRDSMAAIGLAAAILARRHGRDVVLASFAADHVIDDTAGFERTVAQAVAAARAGYVVTVGIEAGSPSTAFGYVCAGEPLGVPDAPSARHVEGFTEKPDAETAARYLATGRYSWNAGMFVVRVGVLLDHLHAQLPALHDGLVAIAAAWDTPDRAAALDRHWPALTRIAIDHAIAEPVAAAGGVAVVPGTFGWDDLGDYASLAGLLHRRGGAVLGDEALVLRVGAEGALAVTAGRTVTVVGVPDAVVVDTPDALLVTTRAQAQQVKAAVDGWRDRGRDDLL
jgi:mannose-1-phosphate guanylyltransferase